MDTKERIIKLLEVSRGNAISGQVIAKECNISRAAVWKVMQQLQQQGYPIHAVSGKGYLLSNDSNILSSQGIRCHLLETFQDSDIYVFEDVDSTNTRMKELVAQGAKNHTMIIANSQSKGRGRFERNFYSPKDTGIYMTLLLKDHRPIQEATIITMIAAIAVSRVIETFSDSKPQIKWVNDILIHNKKAAGILSEAIIDFESGMSNAVVLGIGMNTSTLTNDFPSDIQHIATSLDNIKIDRNHMIAAIANEIYTLYEQNDRYQILSEYRKRSCVLHKTITFKRNAQEFEGYVTSINDDGNLVVNIGKEELILNSGEISIKIDSLT